MKTQNQHQIKPETQSCQMAVSGSVTASELRIGNLVYHNDEIIEIKSLRPQDDDVNDEIPFHAIYGVKLTEEWLLKLGATEEMLVHFLLDRFQLIWKESYNYWYVIDRYNACYYSKVEFVHELQNLYYSLNGSDLTVGCLTDR